MDNIKEFKVNGTAYGLNLSEIGAVINDGGTQKELKQYIDSHSGGGGGGTSSKVVKVDIDWYNNPDGYQSEIKKALEDIYNEVSNKRTVTVMTNGFYSQPEDSILETTNVIAKNKNDVTVYFLGTENHILRLSLIYDEGNNHYLCGAGDDKLLQKYDFNLPYVYKDYIMNLDANYGNISEFISNPVIDNEEFVVLKTTVKAYSGEYSANDQIYKAFRDDYWNTYYLSKIAGMKLNQNESDANYDLITDGEWYVIYCDYDSLDYGRIIITKAVRNEDNTLDVYLGFRYCFLENFSFWDCTVEDKNNQGNEGRWEEKGWTKVSDAQSIYVDSFMARRTMYFCKNTEGVKTDRLTLFKRMK